ncbi:hypothetical protein [Natrinema salaciae]|uniref:hypothetical protein n=1 Tax=Natrinema salaciae TaxID=1186196 RepID=UPI0011136431|nr:hypothetical protein [Natrinema salaciae]
MGTQGDLAGKLVVLLIGGTIGIVALGSIFPRVISATAVEHGSPLGSRYSEFVQFVGGGFVEIVSLFGLTSFVIGILVWSSKGR